MKNLMDYAASQTNPPKQYKNSLEIMEYRNKRLDYWANKIGEGLYTDQVFVNAEGDVNRKFKL